MTPSRFLVPVEYSDHCRAALDLAVALAEKLGATVDIVHVWERPTFVPDNLAVAEPGHVARSLVELIREGAEREMGEFLAKSKLPASVKVEHHLISGEPAHALLDFITKTKPDLIVMSTHGRSAVRHFLMGSVTERIVRHSPVPVLTVPMRGRHAAS